MTHPRFLSRSRPGWIPTSVGRWLWLLWTEKAGDKRCKVVTGPQCIGMVANRRLDSRFATRHGRLQVRIDGLRDLVPRVALLAANDCHLLRKITPSRHGVVRWCSLMCLTHVRVRRSALYQNTHSFHAHLHTCPTQTLGRKQVGKPSRPPARASTAARQ